MVRAPDAVRRGSTDAAEPSERCTTKRAGCRKRSLWVRRCCGCVVEAYRTVERVLDPDDPHPPRQRPEHQPRCQPDIPRARRRCRRWRKQAGDRHRRGRARDPTNDPHAAERERERRLHLDGVERRLDQWDRLGRERARTGRRRDVGIERPRQPDRVDPPRLDRGDQPFDRVCRDQVRAERARYGEPIDRLPVRDGGPITCWVRTRCRTQHGVRAGQRSTSGLETSTPSDSSTNRRPRKSTRIE